MGSPSAVCSACNYAFPYLEPRVQCPHCGSTARSIRISVEDVVETHTELRGEQRRLGFPGILKKMVSRVKRSAKGLLARESLVVDRSDPTKTVKTHHVEEMQHDQTWQIVHDEREEYPAKRRPKQSNP